MDRGGKDARVPLGKLPILTVLVDCICQGATPHLCNGCRAARRASSESPRCAKSSPSLRAAVAPW
eukprot:730704-Pyramimonas_sp.AAC.1